MAVVNGNISYDVYFEGLFYRDPGEKFCIFLNNPVKMLVNAYI